MPDHKANLRITLRQVLTTRFSESELRDLCFDLGIDYENLPGKSKGDRARELVAYFDRRHNMPRLAHAIKKIRSDINLPTTGDSPEDEELWIPMQTAIDLTGYGSTYLTKLAQEDRVPTRQIEGVLYFDAPMLIAYREGWVNTSEASELTDYTVQHIRWLARQGLVRAHKVHGEWLIERASLLAYCARRGRLSQRGLRVVHDMPEEKG